MGNGSGERGEATKDAWHEDPAELRRLMCFELEDVRDPLWQAGLAVLGGEWGSAASVRRICVAWKRILADAVDVPESYGMLGGSLFSAIVEALLMGRSWVQAVEHSLIGLACDVYRTMLGMDKGASGPVSTAPREVLLSLPGVPEQAVVELEQSLRATGSSRQQRKVFREFLRSAADVAAPEGGRGGIVRPFLQKVSNLPSHGWGSRRDADRKAAFWRAGEDTDKEDEESVVHSVRALFGGSDDGEDDDDDAF